MPIRPLFAAAAVFGLLLATPGASADERRAPHMPRPASGPATVFSFGRENPGCGEWTDACRVCTRDAAGDAQCSTPGIACTPGVPVCRTTKAP